MSTDGRMEKEDAAYLYNGILATKMNEIMLFAAIWMDLEIVTLSEVRQKRRSILWHSLYMDSKMKWHKWAYLQNRKRLTENELTVARGEGWGEGQLGCLDGHMQTAVFKMNNQQGPVHSTWKSAQCYVAAWMEIGEEWIHVYIWLSPFAVHLKLLQHC